ncbi:restriction endonuclease subunit S [Photobacterium carnosum]|uniref:restriction endonuclease subunit S n=1 Tax=Photobacterium carnosum TaxID=2023717 RepID=UPI001E48A4D5|nr:restriction endonuclease subunit S [Photobacterium carnosum]MCD9529585.1 restriction endonuclease subunit S [Photobacterium carnosum]MCF2153466.1 restriction endonuclease subunit S [Photobacterium carnosum]MCF2215311.1 restriction endonuclease subunit S [Photobacterium carnosum]
MSKAALSGKYAAYPEYKDSGVEWIGNIPSNWSVFSLKRTVDGCTNGIWGSEPDGTNDITVLRVADFDRNTLKIQETKLTSRAILPKERENRLLRKGDLLIEKSGGGDKTLVGCVVLFDKDFQAVTSNFVAKMTPKKEYDSIFLKYAFHLLYSGRVNFPSIKQTTGIQNLDSDAYLMEYFCFPQKSEQTQIAAFLDHETAKIDTLIEKQQKLIELLKEKRQAVISHAVTKGLNPDAPMKDSGVEWLGEVPEHWNVSKLKFECEIVDCRNKTPEYFDNGDYFVVRTTNVKNQKLNFNGALYTDKKNFDIWTQRGIPPEGSILFTREAPTGEVCLVPKDLTFCMGQRMMNFIANDNSYTDYLFDYLISDCLDRYINSVSHGSTVSHLRVEQVENIPVLVPSLDEIKQIHLKINSLKSKFDAIEKEAIQAIALMQERRTALISAAVTGKIDVRHFTLEDGVAPTTSIDTNEAAQEAMA